MCLLEPEEGGEGGLEEVKPNIRPDHQGTKHLDGNHLTARSLKNPMLE